MTACGRMLHLKGHSCRQDSSPVDAMASQEGQARVGRLQLHMKPHCSGCRALGHAGEALPTRSSPAEHEGVRQGLEPEAAASPAGRSRVCKYGFNALFEVGLVILHLGLKHNMRICSLQPSHPRSRVQSAHDMQSYFHENVLLALEIGSVSAARWHCAQPQLFGG